MLCFELLLPLLVTKEEIDEKMLDPPLEGVETGLDAVWGRVTWSVDLLAEGVLLCKAAVVGRMP